MYSAKEKMSNMASTAKAHVVITKAKVAEKVAKATARSKEGKHVAEEQRKAKEAGAKMRLHEEKAAHASEKFQGKHSHVLQGHHQPAVGTHGYHQPAVGTQGHHQPAVGTHGYHQPAVGTGVPRTTAPTNPLGGHKHRQNKYV